MDSETGHTTVEDALADIDEAAETMWRSAITDTVLELLERDGSITGDTLKAEVIERISDTSLSRIERATYKGALKALDGNPPY